MNTQQSTDLLPELTAALVQAPQILAQREEDYLRLMAARLAEASARLAEEWAEPLARLRAALPAWIHPYIEQPTARYRVIGSDCYIAEYAYVRIGVPGCNPIAAWVSPNTNYSPVYEAMQPSIYLDDDGVWCVYASPSFDRRSDFSGGESDIAVALFQAHEAALKHQELAADARSRNEAALTGSAEQAAAAIPMDQPAPEPADPIDQALTLVGQLSRGERINQYCKTSRPGAGIDQETEEMWNADDRTLVLASVGLAIAHHLRRTADALERVQQWSR